MFDPVSNTFTLVNITVANVGNEKFHGAALAGDGRVVFAPRDANGVGVFDPRDGADTFVLIDISDTYEGPAAGVKYMGAATASDGRVVFAPYYATGVRVFDPVHDTFTSVPIASKMSPTGTPSIHQFNSAATMSDGRVVFGPRHANGVGVFRPAKRYVRVGGHQPRDWY